MSRSLVVAIAALVVAGVSGAYAAGASSSRSINACVHHRGGGLYLAGHCARHDRTVQWNITGPQGSVGPTGSQGPQGVSGTPGAPGSPGAPATRYFAQVSASGVVNASGTPVAVDHLGGGGYLVNFGVDVTHCVAVANEGALPAYNSPGQDQGQAPNGYGVRFSIESDGATEAPGFPTNNTITVATFAGTTLSDAPFYIALLC